MGQHRNPVLLRALFRYALLMIHVGPLPRFTRRKGCAWLNPGSHPCLSVHLQEMADAAVAIVFATTATRAQPANARCLRRRARPPTTPCAMAEASARAVAASVRRDTSVHTARRVSAVPIPARPNCEDPSATSTLSTPYFSLQMK